MNRLVVAPRTVVGYHGCTLLVAEAILAEGRFRSSENRYDWLGMGVYFWEYAPYRALEWARFIGLQTGNPPAVLVATLRLGNCVNLMDVEHHDDLIAVHGALTTFFGADKLPQNNEQGGHFLDRLVLDTFCDNAEARGNRIDAVRGTFPEGEPIYPNSKILSLAHTQIAVRNPDCITRLQLVEF